MPDIGISIDRKQDGLQPFIINVRDQSSNVVIRLSTTDLSKFVSLCAEAMDWLKSKDRPIPIGSIRGD